MPIYEYQCQDCGHELEKLQRMNDAPLRDCPNCEEPRLRRLVSAAGFRLKGGGWYETDFKQGEKRNLVDSVKESTAEQKSASNDSAKKTETKSSTATKSGTETKPSPAPADS